MLNEELRHRKSMGRSLWKWGNSATVVMKHYYEVVDADASTGYWSIIPPSAQNVVSMSG
jgi:hypothetical protein